MIIIIISALYEMRILPPDVYGLIRKSWIGGKLSIDLVRCFRKGLLDDVVVEGGQVVVMAEDETEGLVGGHVVGEGSAAPAGHFGGLAVLKC